MLSGGCIWFRDMKTCRQQEETVFFQMITTTTMETAMSRKGATELRTLRNFEAKYNTKKISLEVVVCCSLFSIYFLMVFNGFRVN